MALAFLLLGRAAHLSLCGVQGRRDARLLVLVLHDGPVKDIVPLEACMRRWQRSSQCLKFVWRLGLGIPQ